MINIDLPTDNLLYSDALYSKIIITGVANDITPKQIAPNIVLFVPIPLIKRLDVSLENFMYINAYVYKTNAQHDTSIDSITFCILKRDEF